MAVSESTFQGCVVGSLSCQKNSYLRSLESKVISCEALATKVEPQRKVIKAKSTKQSEGTEGSRGEPTQPSWLLEFDDSVLFPEGGGQPTDHGSLTILNGDDRDTVIDVQNVQRQGLKCIIHAPRPVSPGTLVQQEVDFTRRWDLMQQHTGQHLLSAILDTYDNLATLGWGMGTEGEMSYVDLPRTMTDEEVQSVQAKVNEVIQQNLSITIDIPTDANVDKLPDDYDKGKGVVRVIKIGDLDNNTCCGTHLQQTSHISLLLLGPHERASNNRHRQYFIAGNRAIAYATQSTAAVRTISKLVYTNPSHPHDIAPRVIQLQSQVANLKRNESNLLAEIAQSEIRAAITALSSPSTSSSLTHTSDHAQTLFIHRPDPPTMDFLNLIASGLKETLSPPTSQDQTLHVKKCIILASGDETTSAGAVLILGSDKAVVESAADQVKKLVPSVKGGGRGERWQGKVMVWGKGEVEKVKGLAKVIADT